MGLSDVDDRTNVAVRAGDAAAAPEGAQRCARRPSGRRQVATTLWLRPRPAEHVSPSVLKAWSALAKARDYLKIIINPPLWFLRTTYQLSISCRGVEVPAARRLAGGALFSLGVSFGARRELAKGDLII